jgi:hypothetical protein
MNLDELQNEWRASTSALAAFPDPERLGRGQRLFWRRFGLGYELLTDLLLVVLFTFYVVRCGMAWQFTLPGAWLLAGAVGMAVAHWRQLLATRGIDPGRPLAEVQAHCLQVHVLELRTLWAIALLAPLAWPAMLVVGLDAAGVDAYAVLPTAWLWANVLLGVLWVPLLQIVGRGLARWSHTPLRLRVLAELATGRRLAGVERELRQWRE